MGLARLGLREVSGNDIQIEESPQGSAGGTATTRNVARGNRARASRSVASSPLKYSVEVFSGLTVLGPGFWGKWETADRSTEQVTVGSRRQTSPREVRATVELARTALTSRGSRPLFSPSPGIEIHQASGGGLVPARRQLNSLSDRGENFLCSTRYSPRLRGTQRRANVFLSRPGDAARKAWAGFLFYGRQGIATRGAEKQIVTKRARSLSESTGTKLNPCNSRLSSSESSASPAVNPNYVGLDG